MKVLRTLARWTLMGIYNLSVFLAGACVWMARQAETALARLG